MMPEKDRLGAVGVLNAISVGMAVTNTNTVTSVDQVQEALAMMSPDGKLLLISTLAKTAAVVKDTL